MLLTDAHNTHTVNKQTYEQDMSTYMSLIWRDPIAGIFRFVQFRIWWGEKEGKLAADRDNNIVVLAYLV